MRRRIPLVSYCISAPLASTLQTGTSCPALPPTLNYIDAKSPSAKPISLPTQRIQLNRTTPTMRLLRKLTAWTQTNKLDVSKRFELLREAISGTMSKFHVVRDRSTDQIMGLKLLDPEKTAAFEKRFKGLGKPSEGEIAVALKHPRLVETYEFGLTTDNRNYVLMEFIDGPGLHSAIAIGDARLKPHRLALIRQMAEAIEAVHSAGYIHRDICPRNFICVDDLSSLRLIDFGLTIPATKPFLRPGNRTGTPLFMAPEIVRRRPTDHRIDLFALGVTAYQLCALKHPWNHNDVTGKAALAHDTQEPTDILDHCPDLNRALAQAIMRCLEPNADNRPKSAAAFLAELAPLTDATE